MKRFKQVIVSVCCVLLLFTTFCGSVAADQSDVPGWTYGSGTPPQPDGEFAVLGGASQTYVEGKYYVIDTETKLLNGTTYDEKLYISLPIEGGFRVQSKHEYLNELGMGADGEFEPDSLLVPDPKTDASGADVLTGTDGTSVRILATTTGFKLTVNSPTYQNIVNITNKQISYAYDRGEVVRFRVELPVSTSGQEVIYLGGETFSALNRVGTYKVITNSPATNDPYSFVNVPLMQSNRGYSIWFNTTYNGDADIAKADEKKATFTFDGHKLDFFTWAGTVEENLGKYTALTGTSGVHEEYAYSFWGGGCTAFYKQEEGYVEAKFLHDFYDGYLENYGFYPRVMGGESSFYTAALVQYQTQHGSVPLGYFHPVTGYWLNSKYDTQGMQPYPTFDTAGNVIQYGKPFPYIEYLYNQGKYAYVGSGYYDASNPAFEQVIKNRYGEIMDRGMMGYMEDFGEKYSYRGVSWNGLKGDEMHNMMPYYVAKAHDAVWTEREAGGQILYARSGTAGIQAYAGNFLGDQGRSYKGLNQMLTANLSLGSSGFNNYGGDLFFNYGCGTDGTDYLTIDLGARHIALCATSPYFRQHGMHVIKAWEHGETMSSTFGTYYYLRENIIPSIMDAQIKANKTASPIVKSMMVAYPYQLKLAKNSNQYLFCDDFLVCAVTTADAYVINATLPDGDTWYDLYTHKAYKGGQTVRLEAPYAYFPMLVRDGSVKAIDLPESQILGAEMHQSEQINHPVIENDYVDEEAAHPSLLITPPDEKRESVIYTKGESTSFRDYDYTTETYVSEPVSDSSFKITNEEGSERTTVVALGVTALLIKQDGKYLKRLDHIPDYFNEEYGFYVEPSGLTTIMVKAGWKELEIIKGDVNYDPHEIIGDNAQQDRVTDDNIDTFYEFRTMNDDLTITLDYDEPQEVGRILVNWTAGHFASYDIEYSVDGENWDVILGEEAEASETFHDFGENWWNMQEARPDAEFTVSRGGGSADVITLEKAVKAQYIRLIPQEEDEWLAYKKSADGKKDGDPLTPAIAELKVFPAYVYVQDDSNDDYFYGSDDNSDVNLDDIINGIINGGSNSGSGEVGDSDDEYEYDDEDWEDEYEDWIVEVIEEDDAWEDIEEDDEDDDETTSGTGKKKKKKVIVTSGLPLWVIILIIGGAVLVITGLVLLFLLLAKKKKKKEALDAAEAAAINPPSDPTDFEGPSAT